MTVKELKNILENEDDEKEVVLLANNYDDDGSEYYSRYSVSSKELYNEGIYLNLIDADDCL